MRVMMVAVCRSDKEKQQLILEIDSISSQMDASNKARVNMFTVNDIYSNNQTNSMCVCINNDETNITMTSLCVARRLMLRAGWRVWRTNYAASSSRWMTWLARTTTWMASKPVSRRRISTCSASCRTSTRVTPRSPRPRFNCKLPSMTPSHALRRRAGYDNFVLFDFTPFLQTNKYLAYNQYSTVQYK